MKVNKKGVAFLISGMCSPFILLFLTSIPIVYLHTSSLGSFLLFFFLTLVFVIMVPLVSIVMLFVKGKITSIHIIDKGERKLPFVVVILSVCLGLVFFYLFDAPLELIALAITFIANGIVLAAITPYWKVSLHVAAATCCFTAVTVFCGWKMSFSFLALPLISWARISRGRHNLAQSLGAVLASLVVTILMFYIFLPDYIHRLLSFE